MRSLVNQFPPSPPLFCVVIQALLFPPHSISFSPSPAFYQFLSSVSQRSLPFTASFSVICVYGCDSAQNKKASKMHAGILEFSFVYKTQETHSLYPHRQTIKGPFFVGNCCVKCSIANQKIRNSASRWNQIFVVLGIIINSTNIGFACVPVQMQCFNEHKRIVEEEAAAIILPQ